MKKKMLRFLPVVMLAAVTLAGCKKNVGTPEDNPVVEEPEEEEAEHEEDQEYLFGYSCPDLTDPFYDTLKEAVRTALEEQGDRLLVKDAAGDAAAQGEQIQELIEEGVDAVFLCPADPETITPSLELLREARIPVIGLETEVPDTDLIDAFVGADDYNAGYVCGQDLLEQRPDGGRVVIVERPDSVPLNERITGFEEAVANGGFEVVKRITADEEYGNIKSEMEALLSNGEQFDAVMCGSDRMAVKVLEALDENPYNSLVYSVDGSPVTKQALADPFSPMEGVGARSPINMGKTAVKVASAILDGGVYEKETYIETFFINKDNVEMYGTDGWQ